jgi:hypothetical protein
MQRASFYGSFVDVPRLTVVDRGFPIWLDHQDRMELLADAELPMTIGDPAQLNVF